MIVQVDEKVWIPLHSQLKIGHSFLKNPNSLVNKSAPHQHRLHHAMEKVRFPKPYHYMSMSCIVHIIS